MPVHIIHIFSSFWACLSGTAVQLEWELPTLIRCLRSLSNHPGFPNGFELTCPVFLQDKFAYIQPLLSEGIVIPTLKVNSL